MTATTEKNNTQYIGALTPERLIEMYYRLTLQPICINPEYLKKLKSAIVSMKSGNDLSDFFFMEAPELNANSVTVKNGIARFMVKGPIYNEDPEDFWVKAGYEASYKAIRNCVLECVELKQAGKISAAVMDIESPGGIGGPLFDLMEEIYNLKTELPIVAYIDNYGFSAAQGLAAACSKVWVSNGARCGSIGSIIVHENISEALKNEGVSVETFIYGKKKDLGVSFKPLTDEAREEFQAIVDQHGKEFTELVAKYLRKSFKAIKDLEAGTFSGREAIEVGIAHRIVLEHSVQSLMESQFPLKINKKAKGVESKMDIITFKTENPDLYAAIVASVGQEIRKGITEEDNTRKDLEAKVTALETENKEKDSVIAEQKEKIKDHEKTEAVHLEQMTKAQADGILKAALSKEGCLVPAGLHAKVEVDYVKFLKEDRTLDAEAYTTAVAIEVQDWESRFEKKDTVAGFGSGGAPAKDDKPDIDKINVMRKQAGLPPVEKK